MSVFASLNIFFHMGSTKWSDQKLLIHFYCEINVWTLMLGQWLHPMLVSELLVSIKIGFEKSKASFY